MKRRIVSFLLVLSLSFTGFSASASALSAEIENVPSIEDSEFHPSAIKPLTDPSFLNLAKTSTTYHGTIVDASYNPSTHQVTVNQASNGVILLLVGYNDGKMVYIAEKHANASHWDIPSDTNYDCLKIFSVNENYIPVCPVKQVYPELTLDTPSITEIELNGADSLIIRWSEVEHAEGFIVYRSSSPTGPYTEIATNYSGHLYHIDRDLITEKTYYYKVQSIASGEGGALYSSGLSNTMSSTPVLDNPMVGIPTITSADVLGCTSIKLSWNAVLGADGYCIRRENVGTGAIKVININSNDTLTYIDTGLSQNTTYAYTIESYAHALVTNTTYYSPDSNTISKTTDAEETIQLSKPDIDDITIRSNNTSVLIEWTNIANAAGYHVYRKTSSSSYELISTVDNATSFIDEQLSMGIKYFYKIQAYAIGPAGTEFVSDTSTAFAVTIPETISAPTIYVIATGWDSIKITWNEISNAQEYLVYRSETKDSGYRQIGITEDLIYEDIGLKEATQYFYKVKARTANGVTSAYSNRDSDSTDDFKEDIDAPEILSISALSSSSIRLRWQEIDNASIYHIYRSAQGAAKGFTKIGEASSCEYTDTGLSGDTTYWYRISAVTKAGTESARGLAEFCTTTTGSAGNVEPDDAILVSNVSVDPAHLTLHVGESYSLYADVRPSNATNQGIIWTSNNSAVVSVSSSGKISAKSAGTATITAKSADGSNKSGTCLVTVISNDNPIVATPSVSGYSLDPAVVVEGESFRLKGVLSGNGESIEKVTVSAFMASDHGTGVKVASYTPNAEEFQLSSIAAIKTGYTYTDSDGNSMTLEAGQSYNIVIYASLSNGEYFRNSTNPSQTVTVTASEEEPFVYVYGTDHSDLNGRTLSFAYNAFTGKTVYVLTNIEIEAWNDSSNAFTMIERSRSQTSEGTLHEFAVNGTTNPYATSRNGELRIYKEGDVTSSSKPLASIKIKQAQNPYIPTSIFDGNITYNPNTAISIEVGTSNYPNGYILENADISGITWRVYSDNPAIFSTYRSNGKVFITAHKEGTANLYISHVYVEPDSFDEIDAVDRTFICEVSTYDVVKARALLFIQPLENPQIGDEDHGYLSGLKYKALFSEMLYNEIPIDVKSMMYDRSADDVKTHLKNYADDESVTENDITYITVCTHGLHTKVDGEKVSAKQLSFNGILTHGDLVSAVREIPGIKILIVDACYSGGVIDDLLPEDAGKIIVLTSTARDEVGRGWRDDHLFLYDEGSHFSLDWESGLIDNKSMDSNKDKRITVYEAKAYLQTMAYKDLLWKSTPQAYGSDNFIIFTYH